MPHQYLQVITDNIKALAPFRVLIKALSVNHHDSMYTVSRPYADVFLIRYLNGNSISFVAEN